MTISDDDRDEPEVGNAAKHRPLRLAFDFSKLPGYDFMAETVAKAAEAMKPPAWATPGMGGMFGIGKLAQDIKPSWMTAATSLIDPIATPTAFDIGKFTGTDSIAATAEAMILREKAHPRMTWPAAAVACSGAPAEGERLRRKVKRLSRASTTSPSAAQATG
jgi:hypothetical protein